jgi:parvulin-like peptidyl-prolyl isomerase
VTVPPPAGYLNNLPKLSTPEDEVVITVNVCDPPAAGGCKTQLTREQFEKRFRTAYGGPRRPNEHFPNATARADQYVRQLAYSDEARKEGLDKDPEFQQEMQQVAMQLLANALQKKLKADTANPPEQALQDYYNKIIKQYEEITVRSVFIPRPPRSKAAGQTAGTPEGAAPWPEGEDVETQKIGDEARRQLAAGEDPDKVEKAAYAAAKSTEQIPSTRPMTWRHNASFPAGEETILFALKPGEVSPPVPNGSGLTIYRLESKRTIPLAEVAKEIRALYQMDRVQEKLNTFLDNAHPVLNKGYFDTEKEAETKAREVDKQREELLERGVPPGAKSKDTLPQSSKQ